MQGKTQQIPILLAGLALMLIVGYSSAKYNFVVRDDGIPAMKATVDQGILYIFRPFKNLIRIVDCESLNIHFLCPVFFQIRAQTQKTNHHSRPLVDLEVVVVVVVVSTAKQNGTSVETARTAVMVVVSVNSLLACVLNVLLVEC